MEDISILLLQNKEILAALVLCAVISIMLLFRSSRSKNKNQKSDRSNAPGACDQGINIDFENDDFFDYAYIDNDDKLKNYFSEYDLNKCQRIAVDTEYYKEEGYNGKLCLIQITHQIENGKNKTAIFDVILLNSELLRNSLKSFLENPNVIKVVHSAYSDKEWIYEELQVLMGPIYDTQEAYQIINKSTTKVGLDILLKLYLNISIVKATKKFYQLNNWKARPLSRSMLNYASFDTAFLIELMDKINAQKIIKLEEIYCNKERFMLRKEERIERRALNFFVGNITKYQTNIEELKQLYLEICRAADRESKRIDINFELFLNFKTIFKICLKLPESKICLEKTVAQSKCKIDSKANSVFLDEIIKKVLEYKSNNKDEPMIDYDEEKIDKINESVANRQKMKEEKTKEFVAKFSCKGPVYENCKMLSPQGEQLCYCDMKKMNWYVSRGLAVKESENCFKLTFKPNGVGCTDADLQNSDFYTATRENICVVCGHTSNFMRFHIMPFVYRQFLPNYLKAHKAHDVVLLCASCHLAANHHYDAHKIKLADQYNVPIFSHSKFQETLKELTKTLNKIDKITKCNIPESRTEEIKVEILNYLKSEMSNPDLIPFYKYAFGKDMNDGIQEQDVSLDSQLMEKMRKFKVKTMITPENRKNFHGKEILNKIGTSRTNIEEFIKMWRMYFLETMKPQFLPHQWRVEHQFVRSFGQFSAFSDEQPPENN